jgi:MFS family permease
MGTVQRIGSFAGPLAGGIIANWMGYRSALLCAALLSSIAVVLALLSVRRLTRVHSAPSPVAAKRVKDRLGSLLHAHWREFGGAGVFCVVMQARAGVPRLVHPSTSESTRLAWRVGCRRFGERVRSFSRCKAQRWH